MNPADRIIVSMPLTELWNENGELKASKVSSLTLEEIREMLRRDHVQFVVANAGDKPKWIDPADTFSFWKDELKQHLCSDDRAFLEDYPNEYFYFASLWQIDNGGTVVVLEKHH